MRSIFAILFFTIVIFSSCTDPVDLHHNGWLSRKNGVNVVNGMPIITDVNITSRGGGENYNVDCDFADFNYSFKKNNYEWVNDDTIDFLWLTDSLNPGSYDECMFVHFLNFGFNKFCLSFNISAPYPSNPDSNMILVPGGNLEMGSSSGNFDEVPIISCNIAPFKISRYEVTVNEFCRFLNSFEEIWYADNGLNDVVVLYSFIVIYNSEDDCANSFDRESQIIYLNGTFSPKSGKENQPITNVSWIGAKLYCAWAGGRLPSEAEWEWAAKGATYGSNDIFSGSDIADSVGWTLNNSDEELKDVGLLQPNELGLYDMTGNVSEWTNDIYKHYDDTSTFNGWLKRGKDLINVIRGGSFREDPYRNTQRDYDYVENLDCGYGFRLVKNLN